MLKKSLTRLCFMLVVVMVSLMTLAWASQPQPYILGPEDVISIQVIGHPDFSGEYLIPQSGTVMLPVVGEVLMTGKSLEQVRAYVTDHLKVRLLQPEVNVVLKVPRPKRIYVFGDVQKPGVLEFIPGWRLQEALSASGGLTVGIQSADVRVILEHPNKERVDVSLVDALNRPPESQIVLMQGDVIRFQARPLIPVYVMGKVTTPALYRMREGEAGILEALAQAGGVTADANLTAVRIVRLDGTEEKVDIAPALLHGESLKLPRLNAGDTILVPESIQKFAILGSVVRPGYSGIPSGQTLTLSQVLALAGGSSTRARLSRVGLIRLVNGKETRVIYDLGKYLRTGDPKLNPMILPGDVVYVPETDKFDINQLITPISLVRLLFGTL